MLTDADVCSRMLTYAHVCSRMLTDADVRQISGGRPLGAALYGSPGIRASTTPSHALELDILEP